MLWLTIGTSPKYQFYNHPDAVVYLDKTQPKYQVLSSVSDLVSEVDGEAPNFSVVLGNRGGEMSRLFSARPPLRSSVQLWRNDELLGSGTVTTLKLSAINCTVEVQA